MTQISQEAGTADARHAPAEPPRAAGIAGFLIGCHSHPLYESCILPLNWPPAVSSCLPAARRISSLDCQKDAALLS